MLYCRYFTFFLVFLYKEVLCQISSCGPSWTIVGNTYCYFVGNVRMSWYNSDKECKKMDSMLLRLYDNSTVSDVQTLLNNTKDTRWWTGLNDFTQRAIWVWDQTPFTSYPSDSTIFSWIREPDDTNHLQNCGALNIQGSVSDERCNDTFQYICEYQNTQGVPCIDGWVQFTSGCYLFPLGFNDPWTLLTWDKSKEKCQSALQGTTASLMTSHLLFIETQDELIYVHKQLPNVTLSSQLWWIGLTDAQQEGQYVWTDNTPISGKFVFWAQEPNNLGGQERCVYTNINSFLGDLNCSSQEKYICMKENDINNAVLPGLGCPATWLRAGRYCYLLETNNQKTWADARDTCTKSGANLMKIDTIDKETWIESQNAVFESGLWFWTGLNHVSNQQWKWSDGSQANMTTINWNVEPNNYKGNENCASILAKGTFNDVSCIERNIGFICELNNEDSPCPQGWLSFNDGDHNNCYYISQTTATYDEAHAKCNQLSFPRTSFLLAINTPQELAYILQQIKQQGGNVTQWFTGLTDAGHEGVWIYDTDFNLPPDNSLIPWTKMPLFINGDENCVVIIYGGQLINTKCVDKHTYICERLAYGLHANVGSQMYIRKFSVSSVFILVLYFLIYGLCLHYILHLTYVLFPAFA